ncbi:MAG: M20/M25/M40 family metallo-hydrolase, partial [Acidobacteriota bacterium]
MESTQPLLLQGHMDMVCETDRPDGFDFDNNPIPVRIQDNGEWVDADGTTLGADNGIGTSLGLALMLDTEVRHGPLELLITVDEETGLVGAFALEVIDPSERLVEYAADSRHARFVTEELVPLLEQEFPLEARPESRGLLGASFGAVAALSTACKSPGYYGRLLLQSGSFAFSDIGPHHRGPVFDAVVGWVNEFRAQPRRVSNNVFVSCGIYESLIYENRTMVPLLQATGMRTRYVEARDGHNWENWRDRLREGLSWLFPGPLWMVYE